MIVLPFVLGRLALDAAFCVGVFLIGCSMTKKDAQESCPTHSQQSHMVNGEGMSQQVSVTLNVNPNQVRVEGGLLSPRKIAKEAFNFLKKRNTLIAISSLATCYWILRHVCLQCNNYLINNQTWAAWICADGYDQFLKKSSEDIIHDLIPEIQRRFLCPQDPENFFEPFTRELDAEITRAGRYIYLYTWLKTCHLTSLFPLNLGACEKLENIKECLVYLKKIFLQWVAESKMTYDENDELELLVE